MTLPEGVTTIGDGAFRECSSLTSVTLPEGVTTIGEYAFKGCSSLTSVTLPEGVATIGRGAFNRFIETPRMMTIHDDEAYLDYVYNSKN